MKLSIILTVYNKEPFLRRSLNSLLHQEGVTECDYEVLAINDGSTDDSVSILNEFAQVFQNLRFVNQDNQGLSVARNNGVGLSKGDYVWFVDADDEISTSSVRLICDAIDNEPDVIPIYAQTGGFKDIRNCVDPGATKGRDVLIGRHWEHCGVFWIIKRQYLNDYNLRFLPNVYHEDSEFTPRLLYFAQRVYVIPKILYTVYCDPFGITQTPRPKRAFDCLVVASSLDDFLRDNNETTTELGHVIDDNISIIINNGLNIIVKNTLKDQKQFDKFFSEQKKLLRPLGASTILKYRVESLLFRLFPNQCTKIYKIMKYMV